MAFFPLLIGVPSRFHWKSSIVETKSDLVIVWESKKLSHSGLIHDECFLRKKVKEKSGNIIRSKTFHYLNNHWARNITKKKASYFQNIWDIGSRDWEGFTARGFFSSDFKTGFEEGNFKIGFGGRDFKIGFGDKDWINEFVNRDWINEFGSTEGGIIISIWDVLTISEFPSGINENRIIVKGKYRINFVSLKNRPNQFWYCSTDDFFSFLSGLSKDVKRPTLIWKLN